MEFLFLLARILYSAIFISSGLNHLTNSGQMSEYAAAKKVPMPRISVLISGVMLLFGGLSVLFGFWVDIGALLLIIFLLPAAFMVHDYWTIEDPQERQNEQIHFFKDLALAGGAFLLWYLYIINVDLPWSLDPVF